MTINNPTSQEYEYLNPTPVTSHTFSSVDLSAFGNGVIGVVVNAWLAQGAGDGQVSSVTWGSAETGLTKAVETNAGDPNYKSEIWYLFDPSAETGDLVVNFSGSGVQGVHITLFYADSDATLSLGDTDPVTGDSDPTVCNLTINTAGALLISGYCTNDNNTATPSETLMQDYDAGGNCAGASYTIGGAAGAHTMTWDRATGGQGSTCNAAAAEFYEPGGGTTPTIALDTADASTFTTDQPQVKFTGTDTEGDDLRYNVQISDRDTFVSGVTLDDSYDADVPGDGTIHPNPLASGLTWQGDIPVDDRPGQSFTAVGGILDSVQLYINLGNDPVVDGTAYVRIYAHDGTYGTSSQPLSAPADGADTPTPDWLAISDGNAYTYDALGYSWRTFDFSGANRIRLNPGTYYVAVLDWVPNDRNYENALAVRGSTVLGHDGNCWIDGDSVNYGVYSSLDVLFRVYTDATLLDKVSGTDAGFENLDTPADTDPFNSGDQVGYTVQSGEALADGDYYWRARVKDPTDTDTYSSWATERTFMVAASGDVTVTPSPASAIAGGVAPTVVKSSISLTPAAAGAIGERVSPTVLLGSLLLTPSPASAIAGGVAPTVVLGSLSITPVVAAAVAGILAPTVIRGSISLTPAVASAVAAIVDPTVQESGGDVFVTPSAAAAITAVLDPSVVLGSISLVPVAAASIAGRVDPNVLIAGGGTSVSPAAAAAIAAVIDPEVTLGSLQLSPAAAGAVGAVVDPTVLLGSINVTPAAASAIAAVYGPTVPALFVAVLLAIAERRLYSLDLSERILYDLQLSERLIYDLTVEERDGS